MRRFVLRVSILAGVILALGACADSPTQADQKRAPDLAAPVEDGQLAPQGCVLEGLCLLPPITVDGGCDPFMELDWSCDDGGDCMTSAGSSTAPEWEITVQGCPDLGGGGGGGGGGTPPPPSDPGTICPTAETSTCPTEPVCEVDCPAEEDEAESDICPQPLLGRTLTYVATIAGRRHEFKFSGKMDRVNPRVGRSPAWYKISGPHLSTDSWWMAESGTIQLVCWGRWHLRNSVWLGTIVVQDDDLHMVMAPGHPDFHNQPPYPPTYEMPTQVP